MQLYSGLDETPACSITQVTPLSIGGGVPCATFVLFDAITTKPCEA